MRFCDEISRIKLAAKFAHKSDTAYKYYSYLAANDIAVQSVENIETAQERSEIAES